jgi:hypothetical protein
MFVCTQAVLIADKLKTPEAIKEWKKLEYGKQQAQVPGLSDDHSGNTFGAACYLASIYLQEPESVVEVHGALSPLVGSIAYGDVPKQSQN